MTGRQRRFFDIDDLAGVRQEDPEVFEETHGLVLALVREGVVDGLRIDHPDGLADPAGYLERLRERGVEHVWVEKILEPGERLRDWPVTGPSATSSSTTSARCSSTRRPRRSPRCGQVAGDPRPFGEVALEAKLEQATGRSRPRSSGWLAAGRTAQVEPTLWPGARLAAGLPDLRRAGDRARSPTPTARRSRRPGWTGGAARRLLLERRRAGGVRDPLPADHAAGDGQGRRGHRLLPLRPAAGAERRRRRPGPVRDLGVRASTPAAASGRTASRWPAHHHHPRHQALGRRARADRGADLDPGRLGRARAALDGAHRGLRARGAAPPTTERYFLFQTLVGAWPIELERLEGYIEKALREAKRNTSWVDQNADWERAVLGFCRAVLARGVPGRLRAVRRAAGRTASRIALGDAGAEADDPGVPDIYQGDELAFRALVDPDNRRPVDWGWNRAMLARLSGRLATRPPDGQAVADHATAQPAHPPPGGVRGAGYDPAGPDCVAFLRGDDVLVVVATRRDAPARSLTGVGGSWRDVLRGERWTFGERRPAPSTLLGRGAPAVAERSSIRPSRAVQARGSDVL